MALSWHGGAGALWRRAPLWRLSVLSAALLTLSFLLFPPPRASDNAALTGTAGALATYAPPPPPTAVPSPITKPDSVSASPAARSAYTATIPSGAVVQPPRSADLSLATSGAPGTLSNTGLDAGLTGRLFSGSIKTTGYDIPLPPGNWALLSNQKTTLSLSNGANVGKGMILYVGKIEQKKLTGMIHIFAVRTVEGTLVKSHDDHIPKTDCEHHNIDADSHWSCYTINYSFLGNWPRWADRAADLKPFERAPAGDLAAKGVAVPSDFIAAEYWRSEAWGQLVVEYMFSPEADGIMSTQVPTWQDSDWLPEKIRISPERSAYVNKIRAWGRAFWPRFKQAFSAASPSTP
jgi:hypothetical protein